MCPHRAETNGNKTQPANTEGKRGIGSNRKGGGKRRYSNRDGQWKTKKTGAEKGKGGGGLRVEAHSMKGGKQTRRNMCIRPERDTLCRRCKRKRVMREERYILV